MKNMAGEFSVTLRASTSKFPLIAGVPKVMPVLWLTLLAPVQAQDFTYTTNNGTITIAKYTGSDAVVNIPSTINGWPVTSIGWCAFSGCTDLTGVTIPNSVTNIGIYAFLCCSNLTSITIPQGVTRIQGGTFDYCINLTNVTIPDTVTSIECAWNPHGEGEGAFWGCSSLRSITIPRSVIYIATRTFYRSTGLTWVYFEGNAPNVGYLVFDEANNATIYYLPGTTGWGSTFCDHPTALWLPRMQTSGPSFGLGTNPFGFIMKWASDRTVVVETCANLANPAWSPVGTNTIIDGWSYFSDPQWTNYPTRFYRLRWP